MKFIIKYIRLIFPHLGLVLIVLAMVLGYFYNWRGKAVLLTTDKTNVFITKNREIRIEPFTLTLEQFKVTLYDSGKPKYLEAIVRVEKEDYSKFKVQSLKFKVPTPITLSVNHPCKMGFGKDLYLISFDHKNPENPEWCVVELVYDPFQGVFLAGIIFLMVGLGLYGLKFEV
jgi:cytochrome c biogenesis protein ResB